MAITEMTCLEFYKNTVIFYVNNTGEEGRGNKAWLNRNIVCRGRFLATAVACPITSALDLIDGSILSIASILTGDKYKPLNKWGSKWTYFGGKCLLSNTYLNLIKTINPASSVTKYSNGIISLYVRSNFLAMQSHLKDSNGFLKKHFLSRITCVGFIVSSVIVRTIELAIGILCAIASFFTFGKFESLNNMAYRGLQVTRIVNDLFLGLMLIANPWANKNVTEG